jgi:hypothetical protein
LPRFHRADPSTSLDKSATITPPPGKFQENLLILNPLTKLILYDIKAITTEQPLAALLSREVEGSAL